MIIALIYLATSYSDSDNDFEPPLYSRQCDFVALCLWRLLRADRLSSLPSSLCHGTSVCSARTVLKHLPKTIAIRDTKCIPMRVGFRTASPYTTRTLNPRHIGDTVLSIGDADVDKGDEECK
jgi:hypothetical protein